jgi:hypothetical protein
MGAIRCTPMRSHFSVLSAVKMANQAPIGVMGSRATNGRHFHHLSIAPDGTGTWNS